MNGVSASSQPVLQHRQEDVVRREEAELDEVVGRAVVFVLLREVF
jgi:hypothetical protein